VRRSRNTCTKASWAASSPCSSAIDPQIRASHGATTRVAQLNGCTFCQDIKRAVAIRERLGTAKFDALDAWRASGAFSPRERAALAFVEEATRGKRVSDATFAEAQRWFDERELAELALLNAIENFYNAMNLALGIDRSDGLEALAREAAAV
jgi:alkylhydroperoxidase family enzyme